MKMRTQMLVTALGLAALAGTSQAALQAVDPGPYTAATGFFPLYYSDGRNREPLSLDLCLSKAQSSRAPGVPGAPSYMCTLLPLPEIFDDALPIVFPVNFPDESFWFTADAAVVGGGVDLQYGAALEAAFGGGVPAAGDQISFARIRIRADVTQTGTYTVTHPYGVETFVVTAIGAGREINMTRDIGIGAPGDFTGALAGDVGPFLRGLNGPYVEVNPDTGALETFVGDPNILEPVRGSPNRTNFVRVEGPNGVLTQRQFAVSGRIWDGQRPTNVAAERSTYRRAFVGASFDVETGIDTFANTPDSNTAEVCYQRTLDLACLPMETDGAGRFFLQDAALPPTSNPPPYVIFTATDTLAAPATTPTRLASALVDSISITRADYDRATGTLVVEATSSDEVVVPQLGVVGFGTMNVIAGSANAQRLRVTGLTEPPALVTVFSSAGGRDVEPVVVRGQVAPNTNPVAVDDDATTPEDTAVVIPVLANDSDPDNPPAEPDRGLVVTGVFGVVNGSAIVNPDGTVTFAPALNFVDIAGFSYSISDGAGGTASATVTIDMTPVNDPPRINSQPPLVATVGVPYSYDVNAVDPDAGDILTYVLSTAPAGMTIDSASGLIQWTPDAAGNQPVTVLVTDNGAPQGSDTQSFTIVVGGVVDYRIGPFAVDTPVNVGGIGTIRMTFTNVGQVQQLRPAQVTGDQNGQRIYDRTLQISAEPGATLEVFFPNFQPVATGDISWRLQIFDDVPDDGDFRSRTTVVPQ